MENQEAGLNSVMSTKDWLITLIITAIPIVGLVMLFVWGFGSDTNVNKSNWAKATLLMYVIAMAIAMLFFLVFGAAMFSAMNY